MTPDYLLHLDFQSIRLFHREESGIWRLVGRAAPDDHALDEAMKALIGRARAKSDAPMHAVISLPHDLVFATKVKTDPEVGWIRREVDIRTALDQALSDPIEDVAFDTETKGEETTAIVVHRDTIAEADGFAKAHGIEPLAFIAMPRDGDGFHRPAIFMQTPLGDERAGEAGTLKIDVPGTAALRGNASSPTVHRPVKIAPTAAAEKAAEQPAEPKPERDAEPARAESPQESTSAEPVEQPSDEAETQTVSKTTEAEPELETDSYMFEAAIKGAPDWRARGYGAPKAEPALDAESRDPTAQSAPKRVVVDPFDKIANPFVERPEDNWWGPASRLLAPLAAVVAVVGVIAGIALYVLPPSEDQPELANNAGDAAQPPALTQPAAEPDLTESEAGQPRDPLTAPLAEDAPAVPVQEPSTAPEERPSRGIAAPEPVAGLDVPEDPTEPVGLAPLPSAQIADSEQPVPLSIGAAAPAHGALASPDAARPPASEADLAESLNRRIGAAQGSAPVPLYDLLEPNLPEDELAEVAARRPEGRPEDLYPVASDGSVLPPEFEGVEERRPVARPAGLNPVNTADTADETDPATEAQTSQEQTSEAQASEAQAEAPAAEPVTPDQQAADPDTQSLIAPDSLPSEIEPAQDIRPVAREGDGFASAEPAAPAQTEVPAALAALVEARPVARAPQQATAEAAQDEASNASLAGDLTTPEDPVVLALIEARPNARSPDLSPPPAREEPASEEEVAPEEEPAAVQVAFTALRPEVRPRDLRRAVTNTVSRGTTVPQPSAPEAEPQPAAAQPAPSIGRSRLTLVGTSGTATSRRALVQMPSGRIATVTVGDRLDGGRVAAIDMTTLVYTRNGRTIRLEIPE